MEKGTIANLKGRRIRTMVNLKKQGRLDDLAEWRNTLLERRNDALKDAERLRGEITFIDTLLS